MSVLNFDHTLTANGSSKTWNVPISTSYMFYVVGNLGGGRLSLECSPDGENWFTVENVGQPARLIRYLVNGEIVRLTLEGANNPNITAGVRQ